MSNLEKISESDQPGRMPLKFAALDPYLEQNIIQPTEVKGGKYVTWGTANRYPQYLVELYNSVPTLRSIINGSADFVAGDDVVATRPLNTREDSPRDLIHETALYDFIFGGFAFQVIRDRSGKPAEVYPINPAYLRTDADNEVFYYSEKWGKGGRDAIVYPKFLPNLEQSWGRLHEEERNRHASSILWVKNSPMQAYPAPLYCAAIKSCEMERGIDDYHLNSLENGFTSSVIVNFNAGWPATDQIKEEVEREFSEKFGGPTNAGRILFSWNKTRDTATTITPFKVEDFGEKYQSLAKWARQQILTAFSATPALFAIMTETTGFNEQEFEQSFRLYNKTRILPVQRRITDALEKVFGPGVVTIAPFNLDTNNTIVQ